MKKIHIDSAVSFVSLVDMFRGADCEILPYADEHMTTQGKPLHYGVVAQKGSALINGNSQRLVAELFCGTREVIGHNDYVVALIEQYKGSDKSNKQEIMAFA